MAVIKTSAPMTIPAIAPAERVDLDGGLVLGLLVLVVLLVLVLLPSVVQGPVRLSPTAMYLEFFPVGFAACQTVKVFSS